MVERGSHTPREPRDPDAEMARERLGRALGGYTLERVVGVGGMAAVYEGVSSDGSRAALKVLHPEVSRRPELRQRFAQEGAAASRVDHPGVVRVLGSGEEADGTSYLVLELLEGEPLGTILRREGALPIPRLLEILDEVLDVLAVAHKSGIVHRDLKPDNLFVTTDQHIKVLDFGIARMLDDVPGKFMTKTGVTLGTVPFMSPEQAIGKRAQVDGRSDLFSLGAMTFRIVARRNVHEAESDAEMLVAMASKPAPPLASVAPEAPPGLAALVDVALAFSKDSRYPDAAIMQRDVRALREGKPPPYATRLRRARDMATRVDMAAPPGLLEATPSPSPSSAAVDDLWPEPISIRSPVAIEEAPISSAPVSRRVMSLPMTADLVEPTPSARAAADNAPTDKMPVFAEPPKDGKTLVSSGPSSPKTMSSAPEGSAIRMGAPSARPASSRAPLFIGGLLIALVSAGTAYYFAQAGDAAPAAVNPTTARP